MSRLDLLLCGARCAASELESWLVDTTPCRWVIRQEGEEMTGYQFRRGDKATIRNATPCGQHIVEGVATLLRPLGQTDNEAEKWLVRFDGDGTADRYDRWVERSDKA